MSRSTSWLVAVITVVGLAPMGCVTGDDDGGSGGGVGGGGGGGGGGGSMPAELVGSWYAGQGYTSVPYDPGTGAWGRPSGKGLVYVLRADGTYLKAFQSYESAGGCTTGFTAFESGSLRIDGRTMTTAPSSGHLKYTASCSPSLDSDEPLGELADETFEWSVGPGSIDPSTTTLLLTRTDGAGAEFMPL